MTKMLGMAQPPCGSRCPHVVASPVTGVLKAAGRCRERVDVEIGRGSERDVCWWSRRLVQLYEDAGLVRLDK